MKQSFRRKIRTVIAITAAMAMALAFMPMGAQDSHAASFSTAGKVSGLKVSTYTGTSVTLKWNKYTSATGYEILELIASSIE